MQWKTYLATNTLAIITDYRDSSKTFIKKCEETLHINNVCEFYQEFMDTRAVKILVSFSKSCLLTGTKIVYNDHCDKNQIFSYPDHIYFLSFNLPKLLQIHKSCFWNAMNKELTAYIPYKKLYSWFYKESQSKRFMCDMIFKNRNFKELYKADSCWAKQMLASEVSKIHNVTYVVPPKQISRLLYENDFFENLSSKWYEGFYLQYYSGNSYHYCVDSKLRNKTMQLGYDTFVVPMPLNLWT